jgi:hypothetical protein
VEYERYVVCKIGDELLRRMTPSAVTWWQADSLPALLSTLKLDSLPDYASNDPGDLQGDAILKVEEKYNEQMREAARLLPSVEVPPLENSQGVPAVPHGERWEFLRAWRPVLVLQLISQVQPLAGGFNPAQQARDGYRGAFERREAKVRGGTGGRHAKAAGTQQARAEEVPFEDNLHSVSTESAEDIVASRAEAERHLRRAEKLWGAKRRRFFEEIAAGAGVTEAAEAVGISRQTGDSYLRKLRDDSK